MIHRQFNCDRHLIAAPVDVDAELSHLEQLVQQLPWCLRQVHREVGKCVETAEVSRRRSGGLLSCVELCDCGQCRLLLAFEVVVALAESLGERVVRVAFAGLPHDRVLLPGDGGQEPLLTAPLSFPFAGSRVVGATQLCFEDCSPFGAEEPVGVEPADGFQEFVLAHADRRRQARVKVGFPLVVLAGPTEVVDDLLVLHVPEHPSAAAVDHAAAEDVLALGLGVAVQGVSVA
ncbi:hypothetical protein ABJI51_05060 [Amycolatopsis sp. NEAU-NG30]|uniref:GAF domain-containing protein n=1 Tax=Amycolatopsis melonis TaxID=3156488 RepID=A0ABV0L7Y5_9PSEU